MFKLFVAVGLLLLTFGMMFIVTIVGTSAPKGREDSEWKYTVNEDGEVEVGGD